MKLTVTHMTGSRAGQTEVLQGDLITVGRDPSNSLAFDPAQDAAVSGFHGNIAVNGDQVVLTDLGSSNGTFVNGQPVTGPTPLTPGASVQFGEHGPIVALQFELTPVVAEAAPAAAPAPKKSKLPLCACLALLGALFGACLLGLVAFAVLGGDEEPVEASAPTAPADGEAAESGEAAAPGEAAADGTSGEAAAAGAAGGAAAGAAAGNKSGGLRALLSKLPLLGRLFKVKPPKVPKLKAPKPPRVPGMKGPPRLPTGGAKPAAGGAAAGAAAGGAAPGDGSTAPAEDAPAEDAPAEDAPAEDAPAEDAPDEDAPDDAQGGS